WRRGRTLRCRWSRGRPLRPRRAAATGRVPGRCLFPSSRKEGPSASSSHRRRERSGDTGTAGSPAVPVPNGDRAGITARPGPVSASYFLVVLRAAGFFVLLDLAAAAFGRAARLAVAVPALAVFFAAPAAFFVGVFFFAMMTPLFIGHQLHTPDSRSRWFRPCHA